MRKAMADVIEFMRAMGQYVPDRPNAYIDPEIASLRYDLIDEEAGETMNAIQDRDLQGIADGCADLIYVAIGTAAAFGIDLAPVWEEVQRSNMAKIGGEVRADGKRLKPPGWTPPDIAGVLARQQPLSEVYPQGVIQGSGDNR